MNTGSLKSNYFYLKPENLAVHVKMESVAGEESDAKRLPTCARVSEAAPRKQSALDPKYGAHQDAGHRP